MNLFMNSKIQSKMCTFESNFLEMVFEMKIMSKSKCIHKHKHSSWHMHTRTHTTLCTYKGLTTAPSQVKTLYFCLTFCSVQSLLRNAKLLKGKKQWKMLIFALFVLWNLCGAEGIFPLNRVHCQFVWKIKARIARPMQFGCAAKVDGIFFFLA